MHILVHMAIDIHCPRIVKMPKYLLYYFAWYTV